jgi:putative tryptophan/tyrosine transport system substrate-binding protein
MRRREFITLLGGTAAAWPLMARAQHSKPTVIGLVNSGSEKAFSHLMAALHQDLREKGYVEGQNLTVVYRWADGHYDRLPALAADLVRRRNFLASGIF